MGGKRAWSVHIAAIAAVGLAIRLVYVLVFKANVALIGDGNYYHRAANLLPRHGFIQPDIYLYSLEKIAQPAADHPPGYIVVLAAWSWLGFHGVPAQQILSTLVSAVTVVVVGVTGRRIGGSRVGLIAAGLAAVYPNLWINDALLVSETLILLLVAVVTWSAYWLWERPEPARAAVLGVSTAALVLTSAEALLLPLILILPLCLRLPTLDRRERLRLLLIAELFMIGCMVPWVAFNLTRFHRPVLVSTGLGVAMRIANCGPVFRGPLVGSWYYPCASLNSTTKGDLSDADALKRKQATTYIGKNAGRFPAVALARLGRTWGFFRPAQQLRFDRQESGRDLPAAWVGLLMYWTMVPASVVGALLLHRRGVPLVPMLTMVIMVSVAVAITFGQTRYRAPAEISLLLLSAVAIDRIGNRCTADRLPRHRRRRLAKGDNPTSIREAFPMSAW